MDKFHFYSLAHIYLATAIDPHFATILVGISMKIRQIDYLLIDINNIYKKVTSCEVLL
jgi:hypothetical protein